MRVTYYGQQGQVRMVYTDVSSIHQHDGNSIVSVNRKVDAVVDPATGYYTSYPYEYPLALINLAPGEYVERSEDAERS